MAPYIFDDMTERGAQQVSTPRFVFDDTPVPEPAKPKGILERAVDIFIGAGGRMAQGVNQSLGAANDAFGLESGVYREGAEYWKNKADEAGSTGLPAKVYEGIGAAPMGVAEFVAGPVYAGVKGAVSGYLENGASGALEKATIETAKRIGIGKIFHGIENTGISGLPKAAAMGGTMGAQTAVEQSMTPQGVQLEDVAASGITGTLLSVNGGGKREIVRQVLIKAGMQPEIAQDLASRVPENPIKEGQTVENPTGRFAPEKATPIEPTEMELATAYNSALWKSGQRGLMQNRGVSDAQFQDSLLKQYRISQEKSDTITETTPLNQETTNPARFVFEDDQKATVPPKIERPPITFSDPQGNPLDVPTDARPPESIGPLVADTDNSQVSAMAAPDTAKPGAVEQFTATTRKRGGQDIYDVRLTHSQRRTLEALRQEISNGEAGGRAAIYNENEPGSTNVSWGSSFPDYFRNKGYSKKQVLGAIDNILSGEGVTANQRIMVEDMHQAKRWQEANVIISDRAKPAEVPAYHLDEGDTLKRNGEEFKVTDVSPDGITLKDGTTLGLNHEQVINYDRGTLKGANGKQKKPQPMPGLDEFDRIAAELTGKNSTPIDAQAHEAAQTEVPIDMTTVESARQTAAQSLNSVYPEGSPDIGLAVKQGVKRDDNIKMPQQSSIGKSDRFKSSDSQVEERWQAANGLFDGPGVVDRTKVFIHKMLSETQHFPEMDTSSFAGKRTADILRRFESSAVAVKAKTAEHLHGLTASFGPKKMDIFTRKVIFDDLMNEADKGRALPFGYTPEALQKDHAAVSKIVETNPDIKAAVKRRADVNKALVMELVDNDLLPVESVLKPEALQRYQKTSKYTSDDINTAYFRHQVLEYANARRWSGISAAGEVRNKQRGWQKERTGSEKDINTNFLEAEFEVFSQGLKELATKKTLDEVLNLNDMAPELKAQAKKEGVAEWKELIPETHVIWQPERGSVFYRGQTLPEQIVTKFLAENPNFADIVKKFKTVTIMGGRKTEVVIPSGLAKTLDSLRTDRESATLDTVNQKMLGAWKIWTLLSPRRAIKYNLNNMSGDLDAAVAADPAIVIKHFNTAWKNAWDRRAGRGMTKAEIEMLDRGVIDAGISINEIPDINKLPGFSRLSGRERQEKLITALRTGDLEKLAPPNVISKYFHWVQGLSQLREGLLREAAYLRAIELLEQGKKVYWASEPSEINALPDIKDKAAKLSRELLGDYGNLSAHGEKIRTRFIPFWSWMEINSPRYYRLFRNAAAKGEGGSTAARIVGVGGRKVAGAALGIAEKILLTQVLFASVTAYNHLMHPDEEERLSEADQKQLHIILGTKDNGHIMTARFQGAFSDALAWFGLEDYPATYRKFKDGKLEFDELGKKMLMATPNKLVNATAPFFKLGGELITGKSIFPDIAKPQPIRDKIEHAARFLSLENEYQALAGKPNKGYLDSLKDLYLYENDPGESAYNNIRRLAAKYLEKNGKESVAAEPTTRSKALYYYKQALRYGDEEAAGKYKEDYFAAGGTREGIKNSINKAHPMSLLPLNQRAKFRQSLTPDEEQTLKQAIDWYREVYAP